MRHKAFLNDNQSAQYFDYETNGKWDSARQTAFPMTGQPYDAISTIVHTVKKACAIS